MGKKLMEDERIIAQKRKIQSDTCSIVLIMLLMSTVVQQYIFNAPFSQYAVEFVCFLGASIYIVIRNIISGNDLYGTKNNDRKLVVVNSLVSGIIICVIAGTSNYIRYSEKFTNGLLLITLIITFICGTFAAFLGFSVMYFLNKRKQKKISEELDKEDDNI